MIVRELDYAECIDVLNRSQLGRLAYAIDGQPFIVPIHYAYHDRRVYCFTTEGMKVSALRADPRAALEVEELKSMQNWATVVVTGRYQELTPAAFPEERNLAWNLFRDRPVWWEPGYVRTVRRDGTERPLEPLYFRMHLDKVTGRAGTA